MVRTTAIYRFLKTPCSRATRFKKNAVEIESNLWFLVKDTNLNLSKENKFFFNTKQNYGDNVLTVISNIVSVKNLLIS